MRHLLDALKLLVEPSSAIALAAVLAAIMSTMSSQLVVCSSALVEDLYNILGRSSTPRTARTRPPDAGASPAALLAGLRWPSTVNTSVRL